MIWCDLPAAPYDWFFRMGFNYPFCLITALLGCFAFGACWGSFMNVCIWRIPRGESVVTAPSHCTSCGTEIRWFDNLPVVSYLVLRGRCRSCRAPYSPRYFIVELVTGLLFAGVLLRTSLGQQPWGVIPGYYILILLSIACGWIDTVHRIIPDALTLPALAAGIILGGVFPEIWHTGVWYIGALNAALAALVIGGFLAIFAWLGSLIAKREVLGWGDVKFMAAIASLTSIPGALLILLAGSLAGLAAGTVLALRRKRPLKRQSIPFGPFLAGAAILFIFLRGTAKF